MKKLGGRTSFYTSNAYTEEIEPRIARMTRMKNLELLGFSQLFPIRVIRVIRG
jgi:hypothetical protein